MNKKNKTIVFVILLCTLIAVVGGYNFKHYYISKNYPLYVFTTCNPVESSCFVVEPDFTDPNFHTEPYVKVEVTATNAPSCLDQHNCSSFSCDGIVGLCNIVYCSEDTKEEGEVCSNENI